MTDRGEIEVTVERDGREYLAGTLWIHERHARVSATFRYADSWIAAPDAYDLDPALPRATGLFQAPPGRELFNAFADSAPDRWGRNLMRRAEAERARSAGTTPRSLTTADYLLGTRDDLRQGAVRFSKPGTTDYHSPAPDGVPELVSLPHPPGGRRYLRRRRADRARPQGPPRRRSLARRRPSEGGSGRSRRQALHREVPAQRRRVGRNHLGGTCLPPCPPSGREHGIDPSPTSGGAQRPLVERFDRSGADRIGFVSARTMLEASDDETRSCLELADTLSIASNHPDADLEQLWRRIVFSVLVSNTDDHLRNHGLLRRGRG